MKTWFSVSELHEFSLSGLPKSLSGLKSHIKKSNWNTKTRVDGEPLARKRKGRGGGLEYHYTVLPAPAISQLCKRGLVPTDKPKRKPTVDWASFENMTSQRRAIARKRLEVISAVQHLMRGGVTKTAAIAYVCTEYNHEFNRATVYNWFKLIAGLPKSDWLPALAPHNTGRNVKTEIDRRVIDYMRADYLRPEKPTFQACFYRLQDVCQRKGWPLPTEATLRRRFLDGVAKPIQVLLREGEDALERMFPPQIRDRSEFYATEAINADGHKMDVFITRGGGKPFRPHLVAIQDLYSGKILAWRWSDSFTAELVRLTLGDMFKNYGIPRLCWFDNGRDFASKMITGGTKTRYRFKIKEEEPVGFLTALGVDVRWARPGRGQSKPIERAFRDFCNHIAKHPKFAGAYTGNSPDNKPSNYGQRAIDSKVFDAVLNAGIRAHNARTGRRTRVCQAKFSFDQVFEKSYANSIINKASEEQLRMCLLAGELRKADRRSGQINIKGNIYWSEDLAALAGEKIIARFDPDNLHADIHIYRIDGSYVGPAAIWEARGFASADAARTHSNAKKKYIKAQKEFAKQEIALSVADAAALLPADIPETETIEPKVVRLTPQVRGNTALKSELDFDVFAENVADLTLKTELD